MDVDANGTVLWGRLLEVDKASRELLVTFVKALFVELDGFGKHGIGCSSLDDLAENLSEHLAKEGFDITVARRRTYGPEDRWWLELRQGQSEQEGLDALCAGRGEPLRFREFELLDK